MGDNNKLIEELLNHLKLGKPILNKRKKPIGESTASKYNGYLKLLDQWFGHKDFRKLNEKDIDYGWGGIYRFQPDKVYSS